MPFGEEKIPGSEINCGDAWSNESGNGGHVNAKDFFPPFGLRLVTCYAANIKRT